jgi:hypothetical protein
MIGGVTSSVVIAQSSRNSAYSAVGHAESASIEATCATTTPGAEALRFGVSRVCRELDEI